MTTSYAMSYKSKHGHWYFPETTTRATDDKLCAPEPYNGNYDDTDYDDNKRLKIGYSFDAKSYLFPCPHRDFLIRRNKSGKTEKVGIECLKDKKYVVICNFYIPIMADDHIASMCTDLLLIFNEIVMEKYDDFVVVLVTRIRSDIPNYNDHKVARLAFNHFFSAFSPLFLALPILYRERCRDLFELTGTSSYDFPGCVVADLVNHKVSHTGFDHIMFHGADFYPFTPNKLREVEKQVNAMRCAKIPLSTFLRRQSSDVLHCEAHFTEFTSSCGKKESLSGIANKVVWLYYLRDGSFMDQLIDLYKKCKDDVEKSKFEVVVVRTKEYLESAEKRVRVDSLLKHPDCCGWLHLPFDDRVSRRIQDLCDYRCRDKLVVVGPNTSYVDPDGKEVFEEFGIDVYPFTKQTVWDNEVTRLRNVRLTDWLNSCEMHSLMKDGKKFPVKKLKGANVLVIFCPTLSFGSEFILEMYGGNVLEWVGEMKMASKTRFEVILFSTCELREDGLKEMKELCTNNEWLRPDPFDCDRNTTLGSLLYGRLLPYRKGLVAFGPDGNLLRLCFQYSLEKNSGPATFPKSDKALVTDVGVRLNSRHSNETWCGALRVSGLYTA